MAMIRIGIAWTVNAVLIVVQMKLRAQQVEV
jgi:hypothetical protein